MTRELITRTGFWALIVLASACIVSFGFHP